jgi:hypothetical protein
VATKPSFFKSVAQAHEEAAWHRELEHGLTVDILQDQIGIKRVSGAQRKATMPPNIKVAVQT